MLFAQWINAAKAMEAMALSRELLRGIGRSYSRTSRPAGQRAHKRWKQRRRGGV